MKNICVAKEPLLLRFNTLAMCLFKYVFISYLKEKGSENTPPPPPKKKEKSHAFIHCQKGVEEEQEALVTPWQPLALCVKGGRKCENTSCDFTGAASRCPPESDWPPGRGRSPL